MITQQMCQAAANLLTFIGIKPVMDLLRTNQLPDSQLAVKL